MSGKRVVEFRQRRKLWAVESFGGKCGICGYSKCIEALDFHHIDPTIKEFSTSASTASREVFVEELRKCICVCSNCHREIHAGITTIPDDVIKFNEDYVQKPIPEKPKHPCKHCGNLTSINQKYCSFKCSNISREVIDWPSVDKLKKLVLEHGYRGTGRLFGVSDNAVRKRIQKNSSTILE